MGGADRSAGGAAGGGLDLRRDRGTLSAPAVVAERPRHALPPNVRRAVAGAAGYPPALLDLPDPPACVYLRGGEVPPPSRCVAIVGSRAASPYGAALAGRLASDLAALGFTIVSGLARGIDAAAHRGALAAGGPTVAVVPSGLDRVTPPAHDPLADEVARTGTLLSELASGPPFGRGAFVKRNRLIAALAAVTVVVEAAQRSGALSTAEFARGLGRPVAATPGDVDRPTARGTLGLLRAGARVCADAGDVLALLPGPGAPPAGADPAARLAAALDDAPRSVDALAARSGLPLPEVLAGLLSLAWAGVAEDLGGQRWRRRGTGAR